jgi:hypothetical protein
VPELLWFKFTGKAGVDDFGLIQGPGIFPLVVSERALVLLKSFSFKNCEIKTLEEAQVSDMAANEWREFCRECPDSTEEQRTRKRQEIEFKYGAENVP